MGKNKHPHNKLTAAAIRNAKPGRAPGRELPLFGRRRQWREALVTSRRDSWPQA
jgi:hypothetical protein